MKSNIATLPRPKSSATTAAPRKLLTQVQLAQRLGISRRTLHTWVRERIVPMIKVRGFCRFEYHKVLAALDRHEQAAAPASKRIIKR